MITLPSNQVPNEFRRVVGLVQAGEAVAVTENDQPTLMILPYQEAMEAQRLYKAFRLIKFMQGLAPNDQAPTLSLDDINRIVHEIRP